MESEEQLMHRGDLIVDRTETEIEVTLLAENGFGFGEGSISYKDRVETVGGEVLQAVETLIQTPAILVPVSVDKNGDRIDDDGCGDGRGVKAVFEGSELRTKSLNRSKVFGGGTAMMVAMEIGSGQHQDHSLNELFHDAIEELKDKQISFGAHTDEHNEDNPDNSGCGAIDKAPIVIANAVQYEDSIRAGIAALGADTSDLDVVFENFASRAASLPGQSYSGKLVTQEIMDNGKVVKQLKDNHNEMYVVLNTIEGQTINQEEVRSVSGDAVQVFGVDVWRMQELALREFPGDEQAQNTAFLSQLVYTLGVSATLTKGDLPVFLASKK